MSASGIIFPKEYAYPVASVIGTFWLTFWQIIKVSRARKAAGIPYPQVYAEKSEAIARKEAQLFNCTQRAHNNTLENHPAVIVSTLIVGFKYPVYAASLCGLWTLSRVFYTIGYSTGDPAKRNFFGGAAGSSLSLLGLLLGATYTSAQLVLGALGQA